MIYDYLDFFKDAGIETTVIPLLDDRYNLAIGNLAKVTTFRQVLKHAKYFIRQYASQIWQAIRSNRYDLVVLEKELLPYVPYGLEKLLKVGGNRLITVYDDAMHSYYADHPNILVRRLTKWKIERIMALSDHVIVWNENLKDYVIRFNQNVLEVNTAVDLRRYRIKQYRDIKAGDSIVIGWIGTPGSYPYLKEIEGAFKELAKRHPIVLRVVSSVDYLSKNIQVDNRRWSLNTEVEDLCSFDIGIMPLPDTEWTRGKSACKVVQYMAVGIPAVCSPVGKAKAIIRDGVNGYLAGTNAEWIDKLSALIGDNAHRRQLGISGRNLVERDFSTQAIAPRLIEILYKVAGKQNRF